MADLQSLAVQSVLYGNTEHDIIAAAAALANSVDGARHARLIGDWSLNLGDCSPEPVISEAARKAIEAEVQAAGGSFSYTFFGQNLGSAAGHNALAERTSEELLLILNPDAQVGFDTIEVLVRRLTPDVGIVEARQIPLEHPKDFAEGSGDTSWASTACALTSRASFTRVDGFDADTFFLYCDDVDYSWRLRLAGLRVVFEPAARVFHDKRLTTTADWPSSPAERYYSAEAALLLAHKYSRPKLVRKIARAFAARGGPDEQRALAAYRERVSEGRLPIPLDPKGTVAQFVGGNYAIHRF